jgi:hypothetical protein
MRRWRARIAVFGFSAVLLLGVMAPTQVLGADPVKPGTDKGGPSSVQVTLAAS